MKILSISVCKFTENLQIIILNKLKKHIRSLIFKWLSFFPKNIIYILDFYVKKFGNIQTTYKKFAKFSKLLYLDIYLWIYTFFLKVVRIFVHKNSLLFSWAFNEWLIQIDVKLFSRWLSILSTSDWASFSQSNPIESLLSNL